MITPSFGLTATERVLPKLALDFTTAALDSRVTFTRTTGASNPATYINSSGVIAAATNNQPRFDYDPVTLVCKGLLIEESRQNTSLYSEDFSTDRLATRVTISSNQTTAPDGSVNGDKLVASVDNNTHTLIRSVSYATSSFTISYFFKAGEYSRVRLYYSSFAATRADFDLSAVTVVVAGTAAPTAQITPYKDGWYRCSMTFTGTGSAVGIGIAMLNNSGSSSFAGNASDGIFVFGEQVEAGAFATSYIPTTTTALTRNADVAVMTGTNFSGWFNASEGTFFAQSSGQNTGTARIWSADDGTTNNRMFTFYNSGLQYRIVAGGAEQSNFASTVTSSLNTNKSVSAYKTNSIAQAVNAGTIGTDTSATPATVDRLHLGSDQGGAGAGNLNGYLAKLFYWPQRLTDAEIKAFSK